ncbi:hypothetical protein ACIQFW_03335 [Streptomyces ardesiacus]|uniref:hypothetical protein n=1 Tax=Streptomyces ardesiacus TaxID=285564 RepID=UPI003829687D
MTYENTTAEARIGVRIAVAGGTGLVGRLVVEEVTAAGHEPVVLARSRGVDLTTGRGSTPPCGAPRRSST